MLPVFSQVISDSRVRRRVLAGCLLILCSTLLSNAGAQVKPVRRVLIIYELGMSSPGVSVLDQQIRVPLDNSPFQIELYREYLETTLFPDPGTQKRLRDSYIEKYSDRRPDVILAVGPPALRFLVDSRDKTFGDVPAVFGGLSGDQLEGLKLDSRFTGVRDRVEPAETLEIATKLQPGTKHVVVVGGQDVFDRELEDWFQKRLHSYESKLDISYLTDLPMPVLLERLGRLPPHTVVLITHIGLDGSGTRFVGALQADPMVVGAANAPVFGPSDVDLGHGEVGGYLESFALQGKIMGEMAIRILNGEKPQDIPIVNGANLYMFDWRALKRWGIKESDLPPASIVLNRQPGFWELYKKYVLIGICALLIQTVAILGLLSQRAERRKIEAELRRSEEKFSKSFRHSPLAISLTTTKDDRYIEVNETFKELTGWTNDEVAGRSPRDINLWADSDGRAAFVKQLLEKGSVHDLEVRIRKKDGRIRTMLGSSELIDFGGERCGLSVFTDITERKQAEEALAGVSRRLIEAQEQERTRIARELHDDINQRIAMLSVDLDRLQQSMANSDRDTSGRIKGLQKRLMDIGVEVQTISHRLHCSKLEYLGLTVACRSFCREVAERHKVEIAFAAHDIPTGLPQDISLCLFRVLQESLNNAIKYSGVSHFDVQLCRLFDEIQLTVRDHGKGFDVDAQLSGQGLGLISIRERASLVKGTASIASTPLNGTEVRVRVPFDWPMESGEIAVHARQSRRPDGISTSLAG